MPGGDSLDEMFRCEMESHCGLMSESLLVLERGGSGTVVLQNLMRSAHSLKGAARIVNRRGVERIAHAIEDCFVLTQHGALVLAREDITVLLQTVDFLLKAGTDATEEPEDVRALQLAACLSALEKISVRAQSNTGSRNAASGAPDRETAAEGDTLAPGTHAMALAPTQDRFLRVTAENLNRLLGLAGDSLVESRWLHDYMERVRQIGKQQAEVGRLARSLKATLLQTRIPDGLRSAVEVFIQRLTVSHDTLRHGLEDLDAHDRRVSQVSHRLYMEVLRARMRPFGDISGAFPRMVRDLAVALGKEVRFEMTGEATQVDREVLASIETSLAHLLRNAVDHGCEKPDDRERAGKPRASLVRLDARQRSGTLVITVTDDGPGVNPGLLRRTAEKLSVPGWEKGFDHDLLELLFAPGFTLRREITEISGRGVGLDLVSTTVKRLRGGLRVENEPGRGMRFTLQLPLTISVLRALLVEICGEPYALPMAQIERVTRASAGSMVSIQGKRHLPSGNEHVRLVGARALLGYPERQDDPLSVVLLGEKRPRAALSVDAFLGERELIVHPLDPRIGNVPDISSASVLDDGAPALIFEPEELIHSILSHRGA
jgi:two-component system sensor histidine kinase and response regulator WspE